MGKYLSKLEPMKETEAVLNEPMPVLPVRISPWRELEFSDSELDRLRDKIEKYSPHPALNVPEARILIIGPVGAGKSSFVNTISSIFNDRITNQTNSGKCNSSLTTVYRQHQIQSERKHGCLRFRLCDTPGLQDDFGPSEQNIMYLIDGNLPDGCQVFGRTLQETESKN